jgi:hypothetical protein
MNELRTREVLLLGSMPLAPAEVAFEAAGHHLGDLAPRLPDGEQIGWAMAARQTFARNPALELHCQLPLNADGRDLIDIYRLRQGFASNQLRLGPYGYAENAAASYAEFMRLRQKGVIPERTRYQVTLAGPGTSAACIDMPADDLLPISRAALLEEVERIVAMIPASDLTIQLDIAMEAEHEEFLRRPAAWDLPLHAVMHWTLAQMAESVAWLANRIPTDVELGFHICSIWHHDPSAGQDNAVLVQIANAILSRVQRPIGYIHLPVIPEHTQADFEEFRALVLPQETMLYLGLINLADGLAGAEKRIRMAEQVVERFGVAFFCGLGRPALANVPSLLAHSRPLIPELKRPTPETLGEVLDLHRQVAML